MSLSSERLEAPMLRRQNTGHKCFEYFVVNMLEALASYGCFPKEPCIYVQRTIDAQLLLF